MADLNSVEPVKKKQNPAKRNPMVWMVMLVFALALISIAMLYFFRDDLSFAASLFPSQTPSPSATLLPSLTPSPSATAVVVLDTAAPEDTLEPSATISPTKAPPSKTPTAFPTATYTATIEGEWETATPSATPRWYLRRNTNTPYPTFTKTATRTPTITLTPTPRDHELRIDAPGPLSKLVSPILYDVYLAPGADGTALIELIGEDGRLITSESLYGGAGRHFRVQQNLEFSIPGVSELARLQFTVRDAYGRITAKSSVDVVLLAMGNDVGNPAYTLLDPYIVWEPKKNDVITGGVLWIDGLAYGVNDQPMILELIDNQGKVIASKPISLPEIQEGFTHARFDVGVPYSVEGRTPALLVLRQESDNRIAGTVYLSSVPIILEP